MRNVWFVALLCGVVGCANEPVSTSKTNNPHVPVSLLFERDGVKVYRFEDGGDYHYYADARGSVMSSNAVSNGKTSYTVHEEVPTITAEDAK